MLANRDCAIWLVLGLLLPLSGRGAAGADEAASGFPADAAVRVPVIDVTDLYHPPQDVGDNFDLVTAYALPEIELRAVVLDCTEAFRKPVADHPNMHPDPTGPRDAGIIPVTQLNYIFDRNVPFGVGPFRAMRSPDDPMRDVPTFQQTGIELILETLRKSKQRVQIVSFGSARAIAAAFNRAPNLMRAKVRRIHLCAGADSPAFLEWNVLLDPNAIVRLLRSDLPIAIYPCATKDGPFAYSRHNTYWCLPDLAFVKRMEPRLRRYLCFALERKSRADFLRAMDEDWPVDFDRSAYTRRHKVWETAVWAQVSGRRLVRRGGGPFRFRPSGQVRPSDQVIPETLRPCRVKVRDNGAFTFEFTDGPTNFFIYERGDPKSYEQACREAIPALYLSFHPSATKKQ
ncbi:MAG: hypothetical protein GXP27_06555 [Planctomycetes bacterium]|nr:hypothetical protein [Planctomycetota bacterium]